jgi:hypothetical protein
MEQITVEKCQRSPNDTPWHWVTGNTFPYRDVFKRWGGRWSKRRKAWYFIGETLPDGVQQIVEEQNIGNRTESPAETEANLDSSLTEPASMPEAGRSDEVPQKQPEQPSDEPDEQPKVRIIKPVIDLTGDGESDAVITAIRQTRADSLPALQPSSRVSTGRRASQCIPQTPCGELTGSISGNVWCYGYAIHDGVCVYLNMGGARMAVEAIRAKLGKGDIVNCVPWDAPGIELTAGEGNTGMYTAYMQNIPEAKFTSLILCHELLTQPNYGGKSTTFILHVSDEQAMAQLQQHVTKLVKVPVFADWTGYLWQTGQAAMLLRPTRTGGDVTLWTVDLDADAWTRLITGGLATRTIRFHV